MPYYLAGDYYRAGDYYAAGGIFGSIGKAVGGILKRVAPVAGLIPGLGPIAGTVARVGGGLLAGAAAGRAIQGILPTLGPDIPPGMIPERGIGGALERILPGGGTGFRKNPRMNVANPKALRRALRRVAGFGKLARRARRDIGRAASAVGARRPMLKKGRR